MRILYFADIRFPLERANGIQTMETCFALGERGHDVRLVVKPDTQLPARDPFEFYGLPRSPQLIIEHANAPAGAGTLARVGYLSFALGRAFGKGRADVILTRDLGTAAALLRIPRNLRPRLVFESHGYAPDVAAALPELVATAQPASAAKLRRLARREAAVWNGADGYVTITRGLAEDLESRHGRRANLAVVPDGMRMPKTAAESPAAAIAQPASPIPHPPSPITHPPSPNSRPIAAYAGHLYAWKGVDVFLHALAEVPELRGLVIGGHAAEPDLARVKELASTLGLAGRVTFTGLVEPGQVASHLARATVLVLPNPASAISTRFTSPLKLFEYMAARRAIVASDLPAIREVLTDGKHALLVEPGNPVALAQALRRVTSDCALGERLAQAAFDESAQYTWARRAERLEALFRDVLAA
jgi:glycosyltransferase involved in cell wall biosynthesis